MNIVAATSCAEARMNPRQVYSPQGLRVHATGGLGGDASGDLAGSRPDEVPAGLRFEVV
jgi:hypothetical protein